MEELDDRTLEGCVGMAQGVGGSERRFPLGLRTAAGKALRLQLPSCRVTVGGKRRTARLLRGEWRRVEWEKWALDRLHRHALSCLVSVRALS